MTTTIHLWRSKSMLTQKISHIENTLKWVVPLQDSFLVVVRIWSWIWDYVWEPKLVGLVLSGDLRLILTLPIDKGLIFMMGHEDL